MIKSKASQFFKLCKLIIILMNLLFFQNYNILKNKKMKKIMKNINPKFSKISNIEFSDILPRIKLNDINKIPSLYEIFHSRELYIGTNNITNKYINYIRRINESEEEIYKKSLFPGLRINESLLMNRKGQYDVIDYFNLCKREVLLDKKIYHLSSHPLVSFVVPSFNDEKHILRTIRSIQNQSFKNIEIIIVDDHSMDNSSKIYHYLLKTDPRIRIFYHLGNLGCWRSRLDGFLYSKGKYVQHFDMGDIFYDNYILEDVFNIAKNYTLDSVRFSMHVVYREKVSHRNWKRIFKKTFTKIIYGDANENLWFFGFGTIWNRLVRANIFVKGLNLVDHYILNAYRNYIEDLWWNALANKVSFSHFTINRIGYIYLIQPGGEGALVVDTRERQEKIIRESIYMWLFDYQILPKNNNKKTIIQTLYNFIRPDNKFKSIKVNLNFLQTKFTIYEYLLKLLLKDKYVQNRDKEFVKELLLNYTKITNKNNNKSK